VDGSSIPSGKIFASVVGDHNSFRTARLSFVTEDRKDRRSKCCRRENTGSTRICFKLTMAKVTEIKANEIGLVESVDGVAIKEGNIFARAVPGHFSFQNGDAFIKNGGQKGPQIDIIPARQLSYQSTAVQGDQEPGHQGQ